MMGAESQGSDIWGESKSRKTCLFAAIPPPSMKTTLLSGELNWTQILQIVKAVSNNYPVLSGEKKWVPPRNLFRLTHISVAMQWSIT